METKNKREKFIYLAYAVLILSPLISLFVQSLIAGENLFMALPTWSDELDYFREVYSFSGAGFSFGGSLFAGYEAPCGPLGAHSFSPLIIWGLISLILPFNAHTILWFNLFLLCLAWLIFVWLIRPAEDALVLSVEVSLLYAPLNMYLYTSMMEVPLYALMLVYFCFFVKYIKAKENRWFYLGLLLGLLLTFSRMTYIVVLFPLIWAKTDYKINKKTVINMGIYVVGFVALYKFFNLFCAGYPGWVTAKISKASGLYEKIKVILYNTKDNLARFFYFDSNSVPESAVRYALLFIMLLLFQCSFFCRKGKEKVRVKFNPEKFSLLFMAVGLFVIMVCLYDIKDYRDFRTFAPIVFFLYLYVFVCDEETKEDKRMSKHKLMAILIYQLLLLYMPNSLLSDRMVGETKVIEEIADLETEDAFGNALSIGATMDINWGDASLMEAIPKKLGYKVFYNNDVKAGLSYVDYVLTTEDFVNAHKEIFETLNFETKIPGYGVLYKVK